MLCEPTKILCVGLNYKSHAEETGGEAPKEPVIFSKFNDALASDGQEIVLPPWHRCYDYEAELVAVMGAPLYRAESETEARAAIGGYTCGNDLSARDCQFRSNQWLIGKSFPGFAPIGPRIVPAAEFDPAAPHRITCELNGATVQDDDVTGMIFSCGAIAAYISQFMPLEPGDLIFTGTPAGVILGHPKGQLTWLKPGDEVAVTIEGIGTLRNKLV
jgi:2-keto-4-pentenoate hydratase/2-oxohepta-3-ene-1,7-dioic acid hydratase in catechol pathway